MTTDFKKSERVDYKYLIPVSMLFLVTLLVSAISVHRTINICGFIEPGGILFYPLTYFFSDVFTEIYGHKISRQILWYGLMFQFIFSVLMNLVLKIPATATWHNQEAFKTVFNPLIIYCVATSVATLFGGYINIAVISRFKILVRGRYFWLRSLTASSIGEAAFTIIALPVIFISASHTWHETVHIVFNAFMFKFIYGFFTVIPTIILVYVIKKYESSDFHNHRTEFNPFQKV